MADIAIIFGFGHADMCAMSLPELIDWRARARAADEAGNES